MRVPPFFKSFKCTLNAAGFIATNTSGSSPGVWTSSLLNFNWKELTPNSEPAGARISAG